MADCDQSVRRQPVEKLSYRIPEAVAATGIGRSTLYDMIKAGELRTQKVRGITLIARAELERLVGGHALAEPSPPPEPR